MTSLSDRALAHLRRVLEWPAVPGDRYAVLDIVGQGGMGTVYRARDLALGREVALKVLRAEVSNEGFAERLRREARILAHLEHPGIVPVHDVGILADGRVFYVMKLIRGTQLDAFAESAGASEVLRVFLRVVETVSFAHANGVIHRDLKPANIMVGSFGEVLVLDWGIARIPGGAAEQEVSGPSGERPAIAAGDTAPGSVLGTPGFMAPEQAQGLVHLVDARTDVFSLGAILRTISGRPSARALASIVGKACAADPADRYGGAAELAMEVTRYLDGQPVHAHRETVLERAGRLYTRYQTPIILVLAYLAMRLLFLAVRRR